MSLEIELRAVDCAHSGRGETIEEIRSPARKRCEARAQRLRGGIPLRPLHPVSQQFDLISLALLLDENTIRIQSFAPNNNSSAIQPSGTTIGIVALIRLHGKKTGPDFSSGPGKGP